MEILGTVSSCVRNWNKADLWNLAALTRKHLSVKTKGTRFLFWFFWGGGGGGGGVSFAKVGKPSRYLSSLLCCWCGCLQLWSLLNWERSLSWETDFRLASSLCWHNCDALQAWFTMCTSLFALSVFLSFFYDVSPFSFSKPKNKKDPT